MSYSKLIHDYLDGELAQTEQDRLFTELAHNSDARLEFNQQMKLHMIAQNDMSSIAPPVATTNSIFSQLGFSIPPAGFNGGAASSAIGHGVGASLLLFFRKYSGNIMTAFIGALLTGFILYYLLNFNMNSIQSNDNTTAAQLRDIPAVSSVEKEPSAVSLASASERDNLTDRDVERMINAAMNKYMTQIDNYYKNYFTTLNISNENNKDKNNDLALTTNDRNIPVNTNPNGNLLYLFPDNTAKIQPTTTESSLQLNKTAIEPVPVSDNSMFNMSFRSYTSHSNVNVNVPSQSNPWFSNVGFGVSYNLSKYHALGLEVGQEAFPQSFIRDLYGEQLSQQQNPMLVWFGASYRYSMINLFIPEVLYPYAEVLGGMTKVGPLSRAQIGLQFRPDKRVTFNLGAEGAILWYNVQGKVYDTRKLGLTYGVSIHY